MGRHKAPESAIHKNPKEFAKMCWDIKAIGAVPLSRLGLVNRESIRRWTKKIPLSPEKEQNLIKSINLWKEQREAQAQNLLKMAREVVEM